MKYLREITRERVGLNEHTPHQVTAYSDRSNYVGKYAHTHTYQERGAITSSPYLKTHTTPEVCTPQPEHTTYRRGGIHTHTHFGPLITGRQWVLQALTQLKVTTPPPPTCTHTHACTHVRTHTHARMYAHTHIHTHTITCTQCQVLKRYDRVPRAHAQVTYVYVHTCE